jgi:uncharacterized protein
MSTQTKLQQSVEKHIPGHWYWADLSTPDLETSKRFYADLFGWEYDDMPVGGDMFYSLATRGGQNLAAMNTQFQEEQDAGVPPHWFAYVTTSDVEASAAKVVELGGTVLREPFDVMDTVGRMAVVQDPAGAQFALWQAKDTPGTRVMNAHGALVWFELYSTDVDGVLEFYKGLFDYDVQPNDMGKFTYNVLSAEGQPSCGVMPAMFDGMTSFWSVYFYVDSVDDVCAKVLELGGQVLMEPGDLEGVGRMASVKDPLGAYFNIMTPA